MLNIVKNFRYTGLIASLFIFLSVVLLEQNILVSKVSAQKVEIQKLPNPNPDKSKEYLRQNGSIGLFNNDFDGSIQNENRLITPIQNDIQAGGLYKSISGKRFDYNETNNGGTGTVRSNFDFDGDGKTDISIFRPSTRVWWILNSSNGGVQTFQFGNPGDRLAPGKYSGLGTAGNPIRPNGATEVGTWSPMQGQWCVYERNPAPPPAPPFIYVCYSIGNPNDIVVSGDFDGDEKDDAAVFCGDQMVWIIRNSSNGQQITKQFGLSTDSPVPADYDGDGKTDIAIFRPSNGQWWIERSSDGGIYALQFGVSTDRAVPADYTGDGKADFAVWRPSNGGWYILRSENYSFYGFQFGTGGDVPVQGDYDGDGKSDGAVYRPGTNVWYILRSSGGVQYTQFGTGNDIPVPSVYVR